MNERPLFEAALEISDPAARQAYLDQACAGQPELRSRVDALLESHADAGSFLDVPIVEQIPPAASKKAPDTSVMTPGASHAPARSTMIDDPASGSAEFEKTHGYSLERPDGADDEVVLGFLSPSDKPDSLGRLAHYEVMELLGHGAFGTVLRAFDEKLHRMVAIKVMSPELAATSPPRKRFLREARAAAAIRHENVVAIHAVEEQPLPYLVMEYIPGPTLQRALDEHGPLDVPDVLRIGQQIACGLAAAHAQGLIHRDIKPSNILLENGIAGRVKITDFGLARAADDASLTQSGMIAGTPLYMSPEQATSGEIDQRSDLFSLGSVLYVMISGRPPFRAATTLAVLKRVVEDTPRPISEIIADTPSWLCAIIAKLQAKSPDDRFSTASEVAELLGRCLADLQANRPVQLPEGMQIDVEQRAETAEPVDRLSASEISSPHTPAPPHPHTSSRRAWPTIAAVALIALVGLGLTEATGVTQLTSTVIRLTTGSGTLVIETDDPSVQVTIDGEEISIQGAGVEQLTLKPGQYQVAAVKNGKPVSQQLVTITRGGKEVVRVTMEGIARIDTPVSRDPTGSAISSTDPDRAAAEWVLFIGGQIYITENSQERGWIKAVADLPAGAFELSQVGLQSNTKVTDAALAHFKDCKHITHLNLSYNKKVTDAGLAHFKDCKNLTDLRLQGAAVTGAGLAHFKDCKNLETLNLMTTQVSDAGLAYFKDCKNLLSLGLMDTPVSDAGLAHFQDCKKLQYLALGGGSQVSDAGLAHFKDCKQLGWLVLASAHVSDAGLAHFKDCKNLAGLILSGCPQVSDAGLAHFQDCKAFTTLRFDNTKVTDEGLAHFKDCKNLILLGLIDTQVTAAKIDELKQALPKCRIEWDGGVVEP